MSSFLISKVRLHSMTPREQSAITTMIDTYYRDEMGVGEAYPTSRISDLLTGLDARGVMAHVWLVYDESSRGSAPTPVGMAICFEGYSTFSAAPILNIHDLIVAPEARRMGVATMLFEEIENFAKVVLCACRVTLEVRKDNVAAQALYSKLGYSAGDTPMEFWGKRI